MGRRSWSARSEGRSQPILGGDGFDTPDLWRQHPEISDAIFITHAYLGEDNDAPQIVAFRQVYAQAYPDTTPDAFATLSYDATRLLLTVINRAGTADPAAVRKALSGIREFDGVTGQLSYRDDSQIPVKSVAILGLEAGAYKLVAERARPCAAAIVGVRE